MRSITAVAVAIMLSFAPTAFATCPSINGPYCLFAGCWYEYSLETTCAGRAGNVSHTTSSCDNRPALQFGTGSSSAIYSFTLGPNDPVGSSWDVQLRSVQWSDPNASIYNTFTATVSVTHNGSTTSQTFYSVNGKTAKNCGRSSAGRFYATYGDTITVTVHTTIHNNNVVAKVGAPIIFANI
jgi:hypothetical protein